eukprot:TRINITY_DN109888_c0_g1_i1.p1 TRINITY_DN109888_c0_g1~~TRINITY_DN109888_c0_g1_i1.p1  ORF type:complete len:199 (+),score=31.35 TRINITY_DN109888_c0_g1_i1:61-597(+)
MAELRLKVQTLSDCHELTVVDSDTVSLLRARIAETLAAPAEGLKVCHGEQILTQEDHMHVTLSSVGLVSGDVLTCIMVKVLRFKGKITHDDGYVKDKPLVIKVVGESATVEFTWDYIADGTTNVLHVHSDWMVKGLGDSGTSDGMHLTHESQYYNKFKDGIWYNKRGERVGTFTCTLE